MFNIFKDEDFIQFKFTSEISFISKLVNHVRNFLNNYGISNDAGMILAIRELVNNAMEHGNRNIRDLKIFVSVEHIGNRRFKIMVEDEGKGFDYKNADLMLPDDPTQIRNRGLSLINSFCDQLDFNDTGNCMTAYITVRSETLFGVTSLESDGQQWIKITPDGDITAENAEEFRKVLLNLFNEGHSRFCFDLSMVKDIDSMGLSIFVIFSNMRRDKFPRIGLEIINAGRDIQNLLRVTHLDEVYKVS